MVSPWLLEKSVINKRALEWLLKLWGSFLADDTTGMSVDSVATDLILSCTSCAIIGKSLNQSKNNSFHFSVQLLSHVRLFTTPWTTACQASLSTPTPRVYSNSSPLSRWCLPTISSSVVHFSSCLQYFLASGSFQILSCS